MNPVQSIDRPHIERTPEVCGGKPRVAGTRIRVQDIYAWHERLGRSPDEIVQRFPQLTLADVHAALAYFWDHRDEILRDIAEAQALESLLRQRHPPKLPAKLADVS